MIKSSGCGTGPMEFVAEVESEEGTGGGAVDPSDKFNVLDSVSLMIILLLLEDEEVTVVS
jgi:hypothetical protein